MYDRMKGIRRGVLHRVAILTTLASLTPALAGIGTAPAAAASDDVIFEGSGWGHGVGLSQYGAYGMARVDGASADDILTHYFTGTSVEPVSTTPAPLWVNLAKDVETITLKVRNRPSKQPDVDVTMTRGELERTIGADEELEITLVKGTATCGVVHLAANGNVAEDLGVGTCDLDLDWDGFTDEPTRMVEIVGCTLPDFQEGGSRPCKYLRGSMVVRAPGNGAVGPFDLSLIIELEDYVLGISEMPYYWGNTSNGGIKALEAQAIAARSYALARQVELGPPGSNSCGAWCHVRDTTVDQRYVGWGHGTGPWIAAVEDTAGVVMTHPFEVKSKNPQGVVAGFYSSSSGGASEANSAIWGGSQRPYLVSVDDHWALLPAVGNPNASWSKGFTVSQVAGKVGLDELTIVKVTARNASGSAKTVEFQGFDGGVAKVVTKTGSWVDSAFGLKSRYFDVLYGTSPAAFSDIAETVHHGDIEHLREMGVALSCDAGPDRYCPNDDMSREDMAAFTARALDLPVASKDYFVDDDGLPFEGDINRLAEAGITKGCNPPKNDRYCPSSSVTRGQTAAFLVRAYGLTAGLNSNRFVDDNSSVFEDDIDRLATSGLTKGCNPPQNDRYCPTRDVTRGEMASFLARALRTLGG